MNGSPPTFLGAAWEQQRREQPVNQEHYVIEGGQKGKDRLKVISRALRPTTLQLLQRVGLGAGMHALDVGCGGGDVTLDMARMVDTHGRVCGLDFDTDIVRLARQDAAAAEVQHVEYQVVDAQYLDIPSTYDVVYARFLLTHLQDPAGGLAGMLRAAKPGGTVVVEEIDFSGHFCYPPSDAFQRYLTLYSEVVRWRGGDPLLGMKLPSLFLASGVTNVQVNVVQPVHLHGESKSIAEITMERISEAVVRTGLATQADVDQTVAEIVEFAARPDTLMSYPRIVQVWGTRPDSVI